MLRDGRLRFVLLFTAGVLYVISAHDLALGAQPSAWHIVCGVLPLFVMLGFKAAGKPWQWLLYIAMAALLALIFIAGDLTRRAGMWPFFIQDLGWNLFACALFGGSLLGAGDAVVTRIARLVHADLSASTLRYTRRLTLVWAIFFGGSAILGTVLFLTGHHAAWSWYSNVLYLPIVILIFTLEYLLRICLVPRHERGSVMQMITAMRNWQTQRRGGA